MNKTIRGLPLWAWISVAAVGVTLGYLLFVRKRKSTGTNIGATDLAALQAGSGQNAAPADSLSAGTLAALLAQLGIDPSQLSTIGSGLRATTPANLEDFPTINSAPPPAAPASLNTTPQPESFTPFEPVASEPAPVAAPAAGPTAAPRPQPQAGPLPLIPITWPWQQPTPGSIVIAPPSPISSGPVAPTVPHGHPVAV